MNDLINDVLFLPCCNSIKKMRSVFLENDVKFDVSALKYYYYYFIEKVEIHMLPLKYRHDIRCVIRNDECFIYMTNFFGDYTFDLIKFCFSFLHSRYTKKSRIYDRIEFMLNNFKVCYFCTFTFNKKNIDLSIKYKRDVLCSLLKSLNTCYIGNVDFGEKRGRMHFHVIIAENDIHICKKNIPWDFGWYDIKVISNKDSCRLGSYIMKLVNHATKSTTKDSIITPRGKWSFNKIMKEVNL